MLLFLNNDTTSAHLSLTLAVCSVVVIIVFLFQLDNVGDVIEKIRIGHDNKGMTPGWHLDKVEVRRLKDDGESSTTYTFPCKRWLAKDEDDGSVVRELIPNKIIEESVTEDGDLETKEVDQDTLERKYAPEESIKTHILLQGLHIYLIVLVGRSCT